MSFDPNAIDEIKRRDQEKGVRYYEVSTSFDNAVAILKKSLLWLLKKCGLISCLVLIPVLAHAWTDAGFNFRETAGYVTDGANETYVTGDAYPTTRGGFTFGWTSSLSDPLRNRDSGVDRRLAGVHRIANGSPKEFRVDLSAPGDYTICIAMGDALFSSSLSFVEVFDDTASKFSINDTNGTAGGTFDDATGTGYSAANWPASNTCVTHTFSSTQFYIQVGANSVGSGGDTYIAHLRIYAGGGGTTTTTTTTTLPPNYTEICGDGIDNDNSGGDLPCPAPDVDRDAYFSNGAGPNAGTDCDDTNKHIFPGVYTSVGCSAGNFRYCNANGTYSSCVALNIANAANFGCSNLYFMSPTGGTSAAGTYADPWNWLCIANNGLSCYHSPAAGDCYLMLEGNYTGTWSSGNKQIDIYRKHGTSLAPITLMAAPGHTWWEKGKGLGVKITGGGSFPSHELSPIQLFESDYWNVYGLEITGGFGTPLHSGGPATGGRWSNNYIHAADGEEDNNMSCMKCRAEHNHLTMDHNEVADCYERQATTGDSAWNSQNNSYIRAMDCDYLTIKDNTIRSTSTQAGYGISLKHGILNGHSFDILRNVIQNVRWGGVAVSGNPNAVVANNLIENVGYFGLVQDDLGSLTDKYSNLSVHDNTVINAPCFEAKPLNDDAPFGDPVFNFYNNICIDNRTTAYAGDGTTGFMRVNFYGSDAVYSELVDKIDFYDNCYYNSSGTSLFFTMFGDTGSGSSGANYSGLAAWKAGTGYDTGSFNENPVLDQYLRPTSTNCTGKGWSNGLLPAESMGTAGAMSSIFARGRR